MFKRLSKYKRPFDRMIVRFREGGILNKLRADFSKNTKERLYSAKQVTDTEVLTLGNFEVPFYILMLMLSIASIVFLIEKGTIKKGKKRRQFLNSSSF